MESIQRDAMVEQWTCLTNLLEYFEKVTELIDQGNSVDILYLNK